MKKKESEHFRTLTDKEVEFEKSWIAKHKGKEKYISFEKWIDPKSNLIDCWGALEDSGEDEKEQIKFEIDFWYKKYAQLHPDKSLKQIKRDVYGFQLNAVFGL